MRYFPSCKSLTLTLWYNLSLSIGIIVQERNAALAGRYEILGFHQEKKIGATSNQMNEERGKKPAKYNFKIRQISESK